MNSEFLVETREGVDRNGTNSNVSLAHVIVIIPKYNSRQNHVHMIPIIVIIPTVQVNKVPIQGMYFHMKG